MVFQGTVMLVQNLVVFLHVPLFASWLNNLNDLEAGYINALGMPLKIDVTKLRNILVGAYALVPAIVSMAIQYVYFRPSFHFNPNVWPLGELWFFSFEYLLLCSVQLEDVKILLMLVTLQKIYGELRKAVQEEVQRHGGSLDSENVRAWRSFVVAARRHVELTGECLKGQILISIVELVVSLSVGLYLVLLSIQSNTFAQNVGFVSATLLFCATRTLQFYLKVFAAESIYSEVSLWRINLFS